MKGDARSAGGMRFTSRRRRIHPPGDHLTQREARALFTRLREKEQSRGIIRRWNDRKLTPEEQKRIAAAKETPKPKRKRRPRPRKPKP